MTITYEWAWDPDAEAAYRAAHDLADDDDIEFGSDEEAREAGYTPRWQTDRHLCTDPEQHGDTNIYGPAEGAPTREQESARRRGSRARPQDRGTPPGPAAKHRLAGRDRGPHLPPQGAVSPQGPAGRRAEADSRGDGARRDPATHDLVGHETACELLGLTGDGRRWAPGPAGSPSWPAHPRSGPR